MVWACSRTVSEDGAAEARSRNPHADLALHYVRPPDRNPIIRSESEDIMATHEKGRIVETPTEARSAEPGLSVLALLVASLGLAVLIMAGLWFVFFRT